MSSGPAVVQRKQIRHCWFTRMLYCPARSPRSFSSRLPGGILASSSVSAASRINSLRSAAYWVFGSSRRECSRRQTRSVSLSANERSTPTSITQRVITAPRYMRCPYCAKRGGRSRTSTCPQPDCLGVSSRTCPHPVRGAGTAPTRYPGPAVRPGSADAPSRGRRPRPGGQRAYSCSALMRSMASSRSRGMRRSGQSIQWCQCRELG